MNFKEFLLKETAESDCIKGEWIYYPNGKLQNAIRSDRNRGHDDLIKQFYITKSKKPIISFLKFLKNHPSVNQEKLKKQSQIIKNNYVHFASSYYFLPPWFPTIENSDITNKSFDLIFKSIIFLIKSDIYNENSESNIREIVQKEFENSLGSLYEPLHGIVLDSSYDLEYYAMKNERIILVREARQMIFDMHKFDRRMLLNCIEAICAKNKFMKINNIELSNHLYSPTVMEKEILIQTFPTKDTSDQKTIKIKDLLEGEKPQTELKGGKGFLKVEPFSKAGKMLSDIEKERWRQRTSESTDYKRFN